MPSVNGVEVIQFNDITAYQGSVIRQNDILNNTFFMNRSELAEHFEHIHKKYSHSTEPTISIEDINDAQNDFDDDEQDV